MDFLELSKKRFATRKFSQETISKEDLNYIMESVRMAPSAVNRQHGSLSSYSLALQKRSFCNAMTGSGSALPHSISSV